MGSFRPNVTIMLALFKFKTVDKVFYLEKEYSAIFSCFLAKRKWVCIMTHPLSHSEK